jgi:hypothetical protein
MKELPEPLDPKRVRVFPLAERESLSRVEKIVVDPATAAPPLPAAAEKIVADCVAKIRAAQARGASVMLLYGAHLIKNGAHRIVNGLVEGGWITHLATNGAGVIHDW